MPARGDVVQICPEYHILPLALGIVSQIIDEQLLVYVQSGSAKYFIWISIDHCEWVGQARWLDGIDG